MATRREYFLQAFKQLSFQEKRRWINIIQDWRTCNSWRNGQEFEACNHIRLIHNIHYEHYLDLGKFGQVLKTFISLPHSNIEDILLDIRKDIYDHYLLCGGDITDSKPIYVGTIMPRGSFIDHLLRIHEFESDEVNDFLYEDVKNHTPRMKAVSLKVPKRLVWLTWDETGHDDPYFFLEKKNAENLCRAMAVGNMYGRKELLLFRFRLNDDISLFKPTWCDANFFDKFAPSDPSQEKRWGQTDPQSSYPIKSGYMLRRPEGILQSTTLRCENLYKRIQHIVL